MRRALGWIKNLLQGYRFRRWENGGTKFSGWVKWTGGPVAYASPDWRGWSLNTPIRHARTYRNCTIRGLKAVEPQHDWRWVEFDGPPPLAGQWAGSFPEEYAKIK